MSGSRRKFVRMIAASAVTAALPVASRAAGGAPRFKAIAFDGFPIFDPRPVFALTHTLFPEQGAQLAELWRTRQFEYQWLRTLSGRYADFWQITQDALVFAASALKLELTPPKREQLMQAYLELKPWPEAASALHTLKVAGVRMALLSNMTPKMLHAGVANGGLEDLFEHVLSTDEARTFKPHPRAYQMALDAFHVGREQILFAAFAGWDAAGAKAFGYPTFWVNRLAAPPEQLGVAPDASGRDLADLVRFELDAR